MEKFLKFLAVEGCEYEIKDGAVVVRDTLEPQEVCFDNIIVPENTCFMGGLNLANYDGEILLPENSKVALELILINSNVKRLPSNLMLYDNCAVFLDAHKIENVSYSDNCGFLGRTIFALWANNDFLIAAGCFAETYSKFEERVNDEYCLDKKIGREYKRKARGCISRLAKKLGKPDPFKNQ